MGTAKKRVKRDQPANPLVAEFQKLRLDFALVDISIAMTFVSLARFDFETGETDHAGRLIQQAERAEETISKLATDMPEKANAVISPKLTALRSAIAETRPQ